MVFSARLKVYRGNSALHFIGEMKDAQAKGFVAKVPHFNSGLLRSYDKEEITPVLLDMAPSQRAPVQCGGIGLRNRPDGLLVERTRCFFHQSLPSGTMRLWLLIIAAKGYLLPTYGINRQIVSGDYQSRGAVRRASRADSRYLGCRHRRSSRRGSRQGCG